MARRGRPPYPDVLTPREFEVLALLRDELSNEEIAERLGISLAGAKYHVSEILGKLGVASREDAAAWQSTERPWGAAAFAPLIWLRRIGWPQAAALVAAIAVAVGIGLLIWGLVRTNGNDEAAVFAPTASFGPTPVNATATVLPEGTITTACPGGPTAPVSSNPLLAYAAADGTIWVASADGANATQLICSATGERNAAWSPSGRYLAHVGEGGKAHPTDDVSLRILDVTTGEDTVIDNGSDATIKQEGLDPPMANLQWSPRDDILFYEKYRGARVSLTTAILSVRPGGTPVALTPYERTFGMTVSPDGSRVLYQVAPATPAETFNETQYDIRVVNADGSDDHNLAKGMGYALSPWSPDGRLIAYWKNNRGGSSTIGDIGIVDVESGREFSLGEFTSDEHPQWSVDPGRNVFYNLAIDPETLSATPLFDRPSVIVNWSPDGTKVAYIEGPSFGGTPRSLVILDLPSSKRTLYTSNVFTPHAGGAGISGLWSPDGRYYAYSAVLQDNSGVSSLFVADLVTGEMIDLLDQFEGGSVSVSYAPDSSRLLIQQGRPLSPSIWTAQPDGSGLTKVADGLALENGVVGAAWRPGAP